MKHPFLDGIRKLAANYGQMGVPGVNKKMPSLRVPTLKAPKLSRPRMGTMMSEDNAIMGLKRKMQG
jgi:hypothetical protein